LIQGGNSVRKEVTLTTMDHAQRIVIKFWNEKANNLDIKDHDRIRVKNVRVKDFNYVNTLNSTEETTVEVSYCFNTVRL